MCRKILFSCGIRQIADNISASRNRFRLPRHVKHEALTLIVFSMLDEQTIHNIDNDKYSEINFMLRNFFLLLFLS